MNTITIEGFNAYACKGQRGSIMICNEMGLQIFWKFAAKAIKKFNGPLEFYSLTSTMRFAKYSQTELKRGLHRALMGQYPIELTKSELETLLTYFNFPRDKYLGEQMKIKFPTLRKYPTGKAWQKEHYNIDHANKGEVNRKRKKPAQNAKKTTKSKK